MSVLVVGAGFTASVLVKTLRASSPELTLTVWEKSRGAGGRQATKRLGNYSCDIGAQYLTHWNTDTFFEPYVNELKKNNVIVPFEGKMENAPAKYSGDCTHYVAPKGMSSLSKLFLTGTNTHFSHKVQSVKVDEVTKKITVGTDKGRSAVFDAVVFTIPAPQLLDITMDPPLTQQVVDNINKIVFTPRFSLMLVYDDVPTYDWVMKYQNDDVVRFLSWDHQKRMNGSTTQKPTLLVHSSAPYAAANKDKLTKEEAGVQLLAKLKELHPELPAPVEIVPHFWRYGQIYRPYPETPDFIVLNASEPLLIAAGDSFMHQSTLPECARAGELLAKVTLNLLKK